jgi:predicted ArsR family transcriptional regulator
MGAQARDRAGRRPDRRRRKSALVATLAERGYEPREVAGGDIQLGNCPFDALVEEHRPLVCGMNLALAEGILDGLAETKIRADLDQQPGRCCITFHDRA